MAVWLLGEGLALLLLGVGAPVPDPVPSPALASSYDLGARTGTPSLFPDSMPADRHDARLQPVTADDGWSPPLRTWGEVGSGPVIELGALGASKFRKRRANIVHLSLDWGF